MEGIQLAGTVANLWQLPGHMEIEEWILIKFDI
jgi:hypothetical protein